MAHEERKTDSITFSHPQQMKQFIEELKQSGKNQKLNEIFQSLEAAGTVSNASLMQIFKGVLESNQV